jgi:hypothetical protein
MGSAARHGDRADTGHADRGLYAVPGVEPRVENELQAGLDAVVAFADFCMFLAGDAADRRARDLAQLAEDLYGETVASLRGALPGQ